MTLLRLVNNCQQRLLCGLFVLICMSNFVTAQDLSPTESLRLENYLNRMNLDRLVAAHLRQRLATTEDADERKMLAEKLANVYATQLLDPKANQEPSETKADANRLFAIYPDLDSPLLRVAIMHARYQQANLDFHQWWYAAQPTGSRQNITDLLRDLIQDLLQLKQRMENRRNELTVSEQFGNPTHSQGLETIENVLIHTQYLIGWSTYFRSVVERGNQAEWLAISEDHFRDFLQIERTKLIVEVAESWFDFDSGWTARGLIGLALCKEAQNQLAASRKCFELLTNANRKSLNEVMPLWKLKSALFAERVTTALQLAQQFKASTTLSADSRVRYWTTACRGGMALLSSGSNDARRLVQLAMAGLTREMQADIIQELVTEYNIRLPSDNFLGNWIQGGQLKHAEDVQEGFDNAPATFLRLFEGKNLGKQLLKIADAPV